MKKTIFNDYIFIILGSMILALGINVFSAPNKLSAGGINSIGTVRLQISFAISYSFFGAIKVSENMRL